MPLRPGGVAGWVIAGLVVLVCAYGFFVEARTVQVSRVSIRDRGLADVLRGKKVVFVTDLHMGGFGAREKEALGVISALGADLIFLTGDFVKWGTGYEGALEFLARMKAGTGVFAVMGDYDYSVSRKSCLFCHEQGRGEPTKRHRIRFMRNSAEAVELPGGRLWVAGVDGQNGEGEEVRKTMGEWNGREPMIILSHNPLNFDLVPEDQDVLMLSGDTHGGQIPLPSWLWGILGYEKNAKYNEGLFEKGRKKLFVSRGIGTSHIPFRLFKRPEVVVLHFE